MGRLLAVTALLLAALPSIALAAPPAGPTAAVSMGDSYISGEAGRWQGNSVDSAPGNDGTDRACVPSGAGCQVDKSRVYVDGTDADGCHRSDVSEILGAQLPVEQRINIACSGAVASDLYRSSAGGTKAHGETPEADQLLDVARTHRVRLIVVSVGGNDLGFAGIVSACFQAYLAHQGPCNTTQQPKIEAAIPKATAAVEKAIDEIRTVMAQDGYATSDYRLLLQTYPSVIPRASEARYAENDPQRSDVCPFYDADLTWGRDTGAPEIGGMVKAAADARGVEWMDLRDAFQGHEFCAKTDQLVTPLVPPSPSGSEWGRFLGASAIQQGDIQELFHPNAFGQAAFAACLTKVAALPAGHFTCTGAGGIDPGAVQVARVGDTTPIPVDAPGGSSGGSTSGGGASGGGPAARGCTPRRVVVVHVRKRWRKRVRSGQVLIGARLVGRFHGARSGVRVDLTHRPAGVTYVRILLRLRGGRTVLDTRRYRICG